MAASHRVSVWELGVAVKADWTSAVRALTILAYFTHIVAALRPALAAIIPTTIAILITLAHSITALWLLLALAAIIPTTLAILGTLTVAVAADRRAGATVLLAV